MTVAVLDELIPVHTPQGFGYTIAIEFENHDNWWTVVLNEPPGVVITVAQEKIRVSRSYTHERGIDDKQMADMIRTSTNMEPVV